MLWALRWSALAPCPLEETDQQRGNQDEAENQCQTEDEDGCNYDGKYDCQRSPRCAESVGDGDAFSIDNRAPHEANLTQEGTKYGDKAKEAEHCGEHK